MLTGETMLKNDFNVTIGCYITIFKGQTVNNTDGTQRTAGKTYDVRITMIDKDTRTIKWHGQNGYYNYISIDDVQKKEWVKIK